MLWEQVEKRKLWHAVVSARNLHVPHAADCIVGERAHEPRDARAPEGVHRASSVMAEHVERRFGFWREAVLSRPLPSRHLPQLHDVAGEVQVHDGRHGGSVAPRCPLDAGDCESSTDNALLPIGGGDGGERLRAMEANHGMPRAVAGHGSGHAAVEQLRRKVAVVGVDHVGAVQDGQQRRIVVIVGRVEALQRDAVCKRVHRL